MGILGDINNNVNVYTQAEVDAALQDAGAFSGTAAGTDTYTISFTPAVTSYASGQRFFVNFTNANTGASTINVNGLGAKAITKNGTTALEAGDIVAGQIHLLSYDGTQFQIVGGTAGVEEWFPTAITLGDLVTSGAGLAISSGAGYYVVFDAISDDEVLMNIGLTRNGITYDGSSLQLELNWMKFGATGGTVGWELDYYFAADGSDSYTGYDGTVTNFVNVTGRTNQIQYTDTLPSISGTAGDTHLQLTLRRNSIGGGSDTYIGDAEVYGINLLKV